MNNIIKFVYVLFLAIFLSSFFLLLGAISLSKDSQLLYIAIAIIWGIFPVVYIFKSFLLLEESSKISLNSDRIAVENFLKQIENTKKKLQIFDDGDFMEQSIYNQMRVIYALKNKFENNPKFKLDIVFNDNGVYKNTHKKLAIYSLKDRCGDNIKIKDGINKDRQQNNELHYKISDGGKYCYISRHRKGEESRYFFEYKKATFLPNDFIVKGCIEDFKEKNKE